MPPMPQSAGGQRAAAPSVFDKFKMGAMMGGAVGTMIGFIFGGFSILQHGIPRQGLFRTLGTTMMTSAATFGFFMGVGSVIRTEEKSPIVREAYLMAQRKPFIMSHPYPRQRRTDA